MADIIKSSAYDTEKQKRRKKPNFTASETLIIEECMGDFDTREMLTNKFTDKISNEKKKRKWEEIGVKCSALGCAVRTGDEISVKWQNMRKNAKAEITSERLQRRESGRGTDTLKKATDQANRIVSIHADASFNGVVGGMDSDEPDGLSFIPNLTDEEDAESESLRSSKLPPPSKIMMAAQATAGPSKSSYQEHKQERVVKRRKTKAEELIDWQIIYFQNQVELAQQEKEINRVKLRVMEKYEKKLDAEEIDGFIRTTFFES
ncbi:uncharacterized protein LOC128240474 [Mya arenaria]|uniref:uncharacterized protein LOC128221321 n=1 Tax=Mya arenaria TaxID=6604 RepID=UPI0022E64814|nr:uncharacterized protein LOC128221321 [Mya arenaria]XP_052813077.1 uncharacterized protein LOC128240474 [Mya arenaria]